MSQFSTYNLKATENLDHLLKNLFFFSENDVSKIQRVTLRVFFKERLEGTSKNFQKYPILGKWGTYYRNWEWGQDFPGMIYSPLISGYNGKIIVRWPFI